MSDSLAADHQELVASESVLTGSNSAKARLERRMLSLSGPHALASLYELTQEPGASICAQGAGYWDHSASHSAPFGAFILRYLVSNDRLVLQ